MITGSNELDSAGTLREAIVATIPIVLAGLGGLWSERAGVVNIGLEGMMILGTIGAGYFGTFYGPWQARRRARWLFGAIGGALHALATVIFGVDHIVSGVAINIMAVGVAAFLADLWFSGLQGGGPTQSPPVDGPASLTTSPASPTGPRPSRTSTGSWSPTSPSVLGALTRDLSSLTVVVAAARGRDLLHPVAHVVRAAAALLRREPAAPRRPSASTSTATRSSRCWSPARSPGWRGGFIVLVGAGLYQNGITNGRGYIGLAAMIFGNWRPGGLLLGALLFGYTDALQLRAGGGAVHALLIVIAIVLLVYGCCRSAAARAGPAS